MINSLERKIALRYLFTKKKDGFINIISTFSFLGISLGVAVLIVVMSVMNGFRTELINKLNGFNPHLKIYSYEDSLDLSKLQNDQLKSISENFFLSNSGEAVIVHNTYTKGIILRGYLRDDFKKLNIIKNDKFYGNKKMSYNHISIGRELSYILNIDIGDKLSIISPSSIMSIAGSLPKQKSFIIDSIFESEINEFNQNIAFLNLQDLEDFFDKDNSSRYLEVFLRDPNNIDEKKKIFQDVFQNQLINSWADLNKSLFSALKVERNVMFIILSLIILIAAFNIISGLTILVKNKTRDIAILKSIGVQNSSITKIFFLVGFLIGTISTIFGILIGIFFSINIEIIRSLISNLFNISLFPEEIYFLSKLPSEINLFSILLIGLFSIIITCIVSIYPAIKASRLDTIKSLKYE
ncbi:FtsX-like permease family protein [Candidatus Pelagibacter sp.]|nr:FtsX-like permease family protein [Candidatus Pelagibacter sp.]